MQPGCELAPGLALTAPCGRFVVGRSTDVDVGLDDPTISRRHLEVRALEQGFAVRCLARKGTTFIDGRALEPDTEVTIESGRAFIQLGRVLLRVEIAPGTIPVHEPIPVPGSPAPAGSIVRVRMDKIPLVWLGTHAVALFPSAARVLARLCAEPGAIVSHDALLDAVDPQHAVRAGGPNLAQLVTYIRDAFGDALEAGHLRLEELRALVLACEPDLTRELEGERDHRALLRALIPSRRGLGYSLRLPASAVLVE